MNQSGAYPRSPNPDQVEAEIIRSHIKWNARTSQTGRNIVVSSSLETAEETVMTNFAKMKTTLCDVLCQHQVQQGLLEIPQSHNFDRVSTLNWSNSKWWALHLVWKPKKGQNSNN